MQFAEFFEFFFPNTNKRRGPDHNFARDPIEWADIQRRATDQSPNGYAPSAVDCPKTRPKVRQATGISPQELDWLPKRRNETIAPMIKLLKRLAIPDFDVDKYLNNTSKDPEALPNIGIAISGGGYRAMLNGAGAIAAWDSRSSGSEDKGNFGGLLQSATYISGLSGGSWLVGSMYTNNFTSVQAAVDAPEIWQFDQSVLKGTLIKSLLEIGCSQTPIGPERYSIIQYYRDILDSVSEKVDAGFDRSITDYWGRMLSYQLVNATNGGPGFTFSSIAKDPSFSSGQTPLPLIVADGRAPNQKIISGNSTVYEINPWEFGTFDPSANAFVPLEYVGSNFTGGEIPADQKCIVGFDNAGFIMGTSSSLFNQFVFYLNDNNNKYVPSDVPNFVISGLKSVFNALGREENDIADWTPNVFKNYTHDNENPAANSTRLTLVDGGEDLQNVPYEPHLRVERQVDVVFSIDSSADTELNWPDGASATATYERSLMPDLANGTGFPAVPGKDTFQNLGLNTRPVFFGCNAKNTSSPSPLIIYIPNYPYIYASNISTFKLSISANERDAIIQNGWAVVTQLNSTHKPDWPVCVACAMLSRSFDRTNTDVPAACTKCFSDYCWDGKLNETKATMYDPAFIGTPINVDTSAATRVINSAVVGLVLVVTAFNL